jgi:hypothetical protein
LRFVDAFAFGAEGALALDLVFGRAFVLVLTLDFVLDLIFVLGLVTDLFFEAGFFRDVFALSPRDLAARFVKALRTLDFFGFDAMWVLEAFETAARPAFR